MSRTVGNQSLSRRAHEVLSDRGARWPSESPRKWKPSTARNDEPTRRSEPMRHMAAKIAVAAALVLLAGAAEAVAPPSGPLTKCPVDAVVSGAGCMDRYEASVWRVPSPTTTNASLVKRIQQGKATAALLIAGGATQLGIATVADYAPCADS